MSSDLSLALEHLNLNRRLVVFSRGKGLRTLGWDGGVALDQLGHHAALGFDAQGERGDVEKQNVFDLAAQNASLECSAYGYDLVWVNTLVRLAATGKFLHQLRNGRHTRGTTDQHNVVNLGNRNTCVLDHLVERCLGAIKQILGDALELSARKGLIQEQWVLICIDGDVRKVDGRRLGGRQFDLCLLSGLAKTLHSHLVLGQVHAVAALELVYEPFDHAVVPVVAAQLVVTSGCANFNNSIADLQKGDVEGSAAEVEDEDGLLFSPFSRP